MLLFIRLVALATAAIVLVNIWVGAMTDMDFLVPDYLLAALTAGAALLPRALAPLAVSLALTFSLGVFSVALSSQVIDEDVGLGLVGLMVADLLGLAAALRLTQRNAARAT